MIDRKKFSSLVAAMLELAGDRFSANSCNDFDLTTVLPDVEDRRQLMKRYHDFNGDPWDFDPNGEYRIVADYSLMHFLSLMLSFSAEIGAGEEGISDE